MYGQSRDVWDMGQGGRVQEQPRLHGELIGAEEVQCLNHYPCYLVVVGLRSRTPHLHPHSFGASPPPPCPLPFPTRSVPPLAPDMGSSAGQGRVPNSTAPTSPSPYPPSQLGTSNGQGACRRACGDCTMCQAEDEACITANREKGGYLSFAKAEFKGLLG